jgi:hypothetical protein
MEFWCCKYYSIFTSWTTLHCPKAMLKCEINTDNTLFIVSLAIELNLIEFIHIL